MFKGRVKKNEKIWIYPYLGGWVFQEKVKIHKKNMPLKSILDHCQSPIIRHPSLPTNTTNYYQPQTPIATTHQWQWGASVVGGGDWWLQLTGVSYYISSSCFLKPSLIPPKDAEIDFLIKGAPR